MTANCRISTDAIASISASCRQHILPATPRDGDAAILCHIDACAIAGRHFVIVSFYMDSGVAARNVDGIAARHTYLRIFQVNIGIAVRHPYAVLTCTGGIVGAAVVYLVWCRQRGEIDNLCSLEVYRNRNSVDFAGL